MEIQLRVMATTDALTGFANRGHFFDRGTEEVERVHRYGDPLLLLMLDIDHFKSINDSYGHDGGDAVLRDFVGCVRRTLREVDIAGRDRVLVCRSPDDLRWRRRPTSPVG